MPSPASEGSSELAPVADEDMGDDTKDMVELSKNLTDRLRVKMEGQMKAMSKDTSTSMAEISQAMNKQSIIAEQRHRQLSDKVPALEHKVDSGDAGVRGRIVGFEAQLQAATDSQVATMAHLQLQAEIRSALPGSSSCPSAGPHQPRAPGSRPSNPRIVAELDKQVTGEEPSK